MISALASYGFCNTESTSSKVQNISRFTKLLEPFFQFLSCAFCFALLNLICRSERIFLYDDCCDLKSM